VEVEQELILLIQQYQEQLTQAAVEVEEHLLGLHQLVMVDQESLL